MRTLDAELSSAMVSPSVSGVYLVAVFFDTVTVAWNSGPADIIYGGNTYIAAGTLGSVGKISEKPGVSASAVDITISGVRPEITALLLGAQYMGRAVTVHYAVLDAQNQFSTSRCTQIFSGRLDGISGKQGATASYNLSVASRLSDWERQRKSTYNDADQQRLYPGDKGLEYVAQISEMKLIWPRAKFLPDPRD